MENHVFKRQEKEGGRGMLARVDFSSTFAVVFAGRAWCVTLAHMLKVADATVAFILCRMGKP